MRLTPRARVRGAWVFLVVMTLGWGASWFVPPTWLQRIITDLSFLAVVLTAFDILSTQDVRKQQSEGDDAQSTAS